MKSLVINTIVNASVDEILNNFNADTMQEATPPFINLEVPRFDGNSVSDQTHLITSICGHYQSWVIEVTQKKETSDGIIIRTEAIETPFPFTMWIHTYHIRDIGNDQTKITDNIKYKTENFAFDLLIYPIIYFIMYYRKPILMDKYNKELNI
ncbi:hypothetical protein ABMA75_01685 [Halobacteriovorax sp. ZH4_bin.1]|uniref:hypothetical protein n=1 Tax=unclassified Halobacteriovorax TaxID=2639665 RepID=UPI0037243FE1